MQRPRGAARVGGCRGPASPPTSPAAACPASAAPSLATGASTATCARTTPPTAPSWRAASTCLRYGAAGRGRRCRGAVCGVLASGLSRPGTVADGVAGGHCLGAARQRHVRAVCPACRWGEGFHVDGTGWAEVPASGGFQSRREAAWSSMVLGGDSSGAGQSPDFVPGSGAELARGGGGAGVDPSQNLPWLHPSSPTHLVGLGFSTSW